MRVFRKSAKAAPQALQNYFFEMLLANPWTDETLPSLVYEDPHHGIVGFLGVQPRPMELLGRRFKMAVATQLMVDTERYRGLGAIQLLNAFFHLPSDIC